MKDAEIVVRQSQEVAPAQFLETVMRAAADPSIDPGRLKELLEIGRMLQVDEAKRQFSVARAAVQAVLPAINKNGLIQYKPGSKPSQFAKWDDIHDACMSILSAHGFTCSFSSELQGGNALCVTMTTKHAGGAEERSSLVVPWLDTGGSKSPAQAAASSFTLAQRHTFVKYWNILTREQDDDGTGKGVPDRITDEQAAQIEDLVQEFSNRDANFRRRFDARLKKELQADSVGQLFQGEQFDTVLGWFREKAAR